MVREVKPFIYGLPGLPAWLDRPKIKRIAEKYGITEEEARERLRLNTIREIEPCRRREHGQTTENECGTATSLPVDRDTLSKEPQDAPACS